MEVKWSTRRKALIDWGYNTYNFMTQLLTKSPDPERWFVIQAAGPLRGSR